MYANRLLGYILNEQLLTNSHLFMKLIERKFDIFMKKKYFYNQFTLGVRDWPYTLPVDHVLET